MNTVSYLFRYSWTLDARSAQKRLEQHRSECVTYNRKS